MWNYNFVSFACAFSVFLFSCFVTYFFLLSNPTSDFHNHLNYARYFWETGIASPHFLFQASVAALRFVPGIGLYFAGVFVVGAVYAIMAFIMVRNIGPVFFQRSPFIASFLTLAPLIASHIFLPTLFDPSFYRNYLVPLTYHNPTQHLNKMFALAIFMIFLSTVFLDEKEIISKKAGLLALSVLCVLSALAKPSFLIAFLPMCILLGGKALIERRWISFTSFTLALVPVGFVLLWQRAMHFGTDNPDNVSIAFLPFAVLQDYTQLILALPLSFAFPIAVTLLGIGRPQDRRELRWAWCYTAIALFFVFFMAEVPEEWTADGNFFWTGQTAVFLMLCQSSVILARNWDGSQGRCRLALAVLGVHFVFGLILAGASAFVPATAWL